LPIGFAGGICVGESLSGTRQAGCTNQTWGKFIEISELILDYWLAKEEDGTVKADRQ